MEEPPVELQTIAKRFETDEYTKVYGYATTPREMLRWFGQHRRTWRQINKVRDALESLQLFTWPEFDGAGIDEVIDILKDDGTPKSSHNNSESASQTPTSDGIVKSSMPSSNSTPSISADSTAVGDAVTKPIASDTFTTTTTSTTPPPDSSFKWIFTPKHNWIPFSEGSPPEKAAHLQIADPVYRVARIVRSSELIAVPRDQDLQVAVTQMMRRGVSHLLVGQNLRDVIGIISWDSIGRKLAIDRNAHVVHDCMAAHQEVRHDVSILHAIRVIEKHAGWHWLIGRQIIQGGIGVGTSHWFGTPLPPNRTGRSPASGSPVDGVTFLRIDRPRHGP